MSQSDSPSPSIAALEALDGIWTGPDQWSRLASIDHEVLRSALFEIERRDRMIRETLIQRGLDALDLGREHQAVQRDLDGTPTTTWTIKPQEGWSDDLVAVRRIERFPVLETREPVVPSRVAMTIVSFSAPVGLTWTVVP